MPRAKMPAAADMVAVGADSGITPLGYVCWFSCPDKAVNLKDLRYEWRVAGLEPSLLPPDPRSLYLFKRAMREQAGRVQLDDGRVIETDVRPVDEDREACVYQISRVVKDKAKRIVEYPKAMRCTFTKASEELSFHPLGGVPAEDFMSLEESISEYFDNNAKLVNGKKVRTLVRKYLKDDSDEQGGQIGLAGENLRGKAGGVYFVAAKHKEALEGVSQVLDALWPDKAGYLYTVPLADGSSERELIRRHHVNNSVKEVHEAIAAVAALLREDRVQGIRSDVAEHHWRRLAQLKRRAAEYNGLLRDEQDDVKDAIEMMEQQLDKLPVT